MDENIKKIISKIYLKGGENQEATKESALKMKADLENLLVKIENIFVDIQISKDEEFRKIKYGKTCAVALDIVVIIAGNKHKLVIQISKLGKFAKFYWEKEIKIIGGKRFFYEMPKDWPIGSFNQIKNIIENYGIKFLTEKELSEKCKVVPSCFDDREKATVDELFFCYDGAH